MSAIERSIRRTAWVAKLKRLLEREGFNLTRKMFEASLLLFIYHKATPEWQAELQVNFSDQRNMLDLNGTALHFSDQRTLLGLLNVMRATHAGNVGEAREREAEAKRWMDRQESELKGVTMPLGVNVRIIRLRPFAGCYRVTLDDGHPLEHLTKEQLKELLELCCRFSQKR
jgi:hypothetical protein